MILIKDQKLKHTEVYDEPLEHRRKGIKDVGG